MVTTDQVWRILEEIPDPEIPVISIVDLGIAREVNIHDTGVEICITPTYSGCPAMHAIENDIVRKLTEEGIPNVRVRMVYSPVWTTDWITDAAKERLRQYGIAPPEKSTTNKGALLGKTREVACPRCGAKHTSLVSEFGSTACKALYRCEVCKEPFDHFKCH
ncbi:MAG: 1,2-phenylacetyl-CoA epoxidase subunit PaaD [Bacteroidota bacterium]|jgi:ring-1,2-phenylacetyl-CoA epoxidase subunit PaaD|nr:phenylacetate-CoA oxygenase subunit PaaJ [Bacteroidia bacterium]MBP7438479.1 phenylacetate-CoA oxygenase subunit PaaJ [Bacteroidia bacterium]MBP7728729.1 phenylacetate-CoA oxygenase subunit PaaJ [Bacteroidia bacterium]MBP7772965.1 phenylacetate-CoA oxygenase subunit PaaJ [Bacteroidia bacterium]